MAGQLLHIGFHMALSSVDHTPDPAQNRQRSLTLKTLKQGGKVTALRMTRHGFIGVFISGDHGQQACLFQVLIEIVKQRIAGIIQ